MSGVRKLWTRNSPSREHVCTKN